MLENRNTKYNIRIVFIYLTMHACMDGNKWCMAIIEPAYHIGIYDNTLKGFFNQGTVIRTTITVTVIEVLFTTRDPYTTKKKVNSLYMII